MRDFIKALLGLLIVAGTSGTMPRWAAADDPGEADAVFEEGRAQPAEGDGEIGGNAEAPDRLEFTGVEVGMNDLPGVEATVMEDDKITVMLDDVEMVDVVRMFTRISGANIIVDPTNLVGTVTVNLTEVDWDVGLNAILDMHNLHLRETTMDSGVYAIGRKDPQAPEPLVVETIFLKYARVEDVRRSIEPILGDRARLSPFPTRNALVVSATAENLREIKGVIETIDSMREQVFIEAKFMELDDGAIQNLGVNWQSLEGVGLDVGNLGWSYSAARSRADTHDRSDFWSESETREREERESLALDFAGDPIIREEVIVLRDAEGNVISERTSEIPTSLLDDRFSTESGSGMAFEADETYGRTAEDVRTAVMGIDDFRVVLSALRQTEGVTVVSNPKIIVANEETATIHIGETERPFVSTVTPATDSSAPFTTYNPGDPVEFGVKLDVTPTVNTASNISLVVSPTLTRFVRNAIAPTGQSYPIIARKTISTRFTLQDGKTVAIGGLTETRDRDNVAKVPLLGDIPVIGKYLFTHKSTERRQTETIIFVTVALARPDAIDPAQGFPGNTELTHRELLREEWRRQEAQQMLERMKSGMQEERRKPRARLGGSRL